MVGNEERRNFAAALAAFDQLRAAGYPPDLADRLPPLHEVLGRVVRSAPPRKRPIWDGIWELLDLLSFDFSGSRGSGSAADLKADLIVLSEQADALRSAIGARPQFALADQRCAGKLGPRKDAGTLPPVGALADYLLCVATSLVHRNDHDGRPRPATDPAGTPR